MPKKKLNVVRPTLRHKKRYVELEFLSNDLNLDKKELYKLLCRNYLESNGVFMQVNANITVMVFDSANNKALIRVNKAQLDLFLGSLLFLSNKIGLIAIKSVNSTLKQLN